MEKFTKTAWALSLSLFLILSCSKDDDIITPENMEQTISKGKWEVTYYWDEDENKTEEFTGFIYEFHDGGKATITNLSKKIDGNWSTGNDEQSIRFYINFGATDPYGELNDNWEVSERTSTRIKLKEDDHDGSPDYLTFEKL